MVYVTSPHAWYTLPVYTGPRVVLMLGRVAVCCPNARTMGVYRMVYMVYMAAGRAVRGVGVMYGVYHVVYIEVPFKISGALPRDLPK